MATAAEIQVAYKAIYRTDLNATVAAAIANSGISVDAYIAQQLPQVASTTQAAVAIASFVTGTAPTSDKLDALKIEADKQVASYAALGQNATLGAYEAFGRSFATDATTTAGFNTKYGALSTADFIAVVYAQVYGTQPSAGAAANLTAQINYFTNLYTTNGVANAALAAKGAVLGQIVGYAFTSAASANSNLDNQVQSLLTSAAKGDTTVYNKALPTVVDPGTVGVTLTASSTVEISPTAADPANKSTANNDTVNFALTNTVATDAATKINAGAGEDTLNLTNLASAYAPTAGIVQNVEKVTVTTAAGGGSVDFTNISGVKQVTLNTGSTVDAVAFNNLALDATVVVKANTLATPLTIDYTGATATTGSITLDGVSKGTVIFNDATVKTVNITTSGTANELAINDAQVETVKVSGTGSFVSTGNTLTALKSFDASGVGTFSNVNFTGAAFANKGTFTLGAGSDTFEFDANKAHTVTLGNGNDTVEINVGATNNLNDNGIATNAVVVDNVVTVTDLKVSGNTGDLIRLDATATGRTELTSTQLDNVAASATLLAAATAVGAFTAPSAVDTWAFFKFGTDTYAYYDVGNDGFTAPDALIKLTGVDFATLSFTGATQNVFLV